MALNAFLMDFNTFFFTEFSSGSRPKTTRKTSQKGQNTLLEAFPEYPEVANKPSSLTCLYCIFAFLERHVKIMRGHSKQNKLFQGLFFNRGRAWVIFLIISYFFEFINSVFGLVVF